MKYKILLPVTTSPELVKQRLTDLNQDIENLILVNNFDYPAILQLSKEVVDKGAEVYHCPFNLGLAASWNLGLRRMIEDDYDLCIILSVSANLKKDIREFVDEILKQESKQQSSRYICSIATASLHCFAHTKLSIELGGYYDENFWPIYLEDTDYCHRGKFNRINQTCMSLTRSDIVESIGFSIALNKDDRLLKLYQHNSGRHLRYYVEKWGGYQNSEIYSHPFNDPNIGVNEWSIWEPFHHLLIDNDKWIPPQYPYTEMRLMP